jgi:hypothetical protein
VAPGFISSTFYQLAYTAGFAHRPGQRFEALPQAVNLVALPRRSRYIRPVRKSNMRAETEKLVEDIKRSIGLLRRHL